MQIYAHLEGPDFPKLRVPSEVSFLLPLALFQVPMDNYANQFNISMNKSVHHIKIN